MARSDVPETSGSSGLHGVDRLDRLASPSRAGLWETSQIVAFYILSKVLLLTSYVAFALLALLALRPRTLLRAGPLLPLTVSTFALTLFVAAVFLPTTRMSSVPLAFAALLLQAVKCERQSRRMCGETAPEQRSAAA